MEMQSILSTQQQRELPSELRTVSTAKGFTLQLVCCCRPSHVQIGEIVSFATYQASPTNIARVLLQK